MVQNHRFLATIQGNMVTCTVLAATEFFNFCVNVMMLPPLTEKLSDGCTHSLYVHHGLSCSNGGLIIPHKKSCVASYSTSLDNPYHLTAYTANPSSIKETADQSMGYVRGGEDWIQEATLPFEYYGKARLTP